MASGVYRIISSSKSRQERKSCYAQEPSTHRNCCNFPGLGPANSFRPWSSIGFGASACRAIFRTIWDQLLLSANRPTLNRTLRSWPGRIGAGIQYLLRRSGRSPLALTRSGGWPDPAPALRQAIPSCTAIRSATSLPREKPESSLCRTPTRASSWVLIRAAPPAKDSSRSAHLIHMHRLGSPRAI